MVGMHTQHGVHFLDISLYLEKWTVMKSIKWCGWNPNLCGHITHTLVFYPSTLSRLEGYCHCLRWPSVCTFVSFSTVSRKYFSKNLICHFFTICALWCCRMTVHSLQSEQHIPHCEWQSQMEMTRVPRSSSQVASPSGEHALIQFTRFRWQTMQWYVSFINLSFHLSIYLQCCNIDKLN